ncbi:MAG: cell division ATP-binding protein FtsE [Nitrospinae bacterium CG11_big_fil_rev_8_21_14_0_20_56_8]|nr:MAG: cell division ATP-binding protein FtsE [Nitrospinae bacterium CG11_big_fil_rev_8_21_14_0_20_56_8]
MIQIFNLYKTYGGAAPALNDISLSVRRGEFVFLTGPSGAGKTTLLRILYGWENFDRGQVLVHGINIVKLNESNVFLLRRRIGIVFQDYKLLPRKTVFENVAFAQEIIGTERRLIRQKTWEALRDVGLTNKKDFYPRQLSGGEQQRAAIARALVNSPDLILADEPTGNLDPEIGIEILRLFEEAQDRGVTVIFATHSQEMVRSGKHPVIMLSRGQRIKP